MTATNANSSTPFRSPSRTPIVGVLDSGVGGLTVLAHIIRKQKFAHYIYFADTAWCPYGPRSEEEVRARVVAIVEWLLKQGCSLVVLACNTATAAAVDYLRAHYPIPFVGMEPAVKPAALGSRTRHIGVLATKGTFAGRLFQQAVETYSRQVEIHHAVGEGLVELVEGDNYRGEEAKRLLSALLAPLVEQRIDHLVLGCTHYPFFTPLLRELLPPEIEIVDPAPAVANRTISLLPAVEGEGASLRLVSSGNALELQAPLRYYFSALALTPPPRIEYQSDIRLEKTELQKS